MNIYFYVTIKYGEKYYRHNTLVRFPTPSRLPSQTNSLYASGLGVTRIISTLDVQSILSKIGVNVISALSNGTRWVPHMSRQRTWSPTRSSAAVIAQQASIPGCGRGSRRRATVSRGRGTVARSHDVTHACAQLLRGTDCVRDSARRAATSFAGLQRKWLGSCASDKQGWFPIFTLKRWFTWGFMVWGLYC